MQMRNVLLAGVAIVSLLTSLPSSAETAPSVALTQNVVPQDWPVIPKASTGAPNIVLVLTDDVGFGAASAFGGPVPTPNLERLASSGLTYNRFHTTAMCSPTRAALLTGRNHHSAGTGALTDFAMGAPGYTGMIPRSAATVAEVLRQSGYNTAFFGKHHNMPRGPFGSSGPRGYWPTDLGFEYFFGFIGSDTDQFHPTLYRGTSRVIDTEPQPILDRRLVDEAIQWIHQQKAVAPDNPFFVYLAPATAHTPHQAPKEWLERFRGQFDIGWNQVRSQTLARQQAMGIVPSSTRLPDWPEDLPRWETLPPQEQAFQARAMEAFAAQLAYQDDQFGRILDEIQRMGLSENTLIIFIEGDNGPDAAASPDGALAEAGEIGNRRLTPEEHWRMIGTIGGPESHSNYGTGWALAMSTPFPYYKQIASHLGGTRNGMVISWPAQIRGHGLRSQYSHVIDIFPTVLSAAGLEMPAVINGVEQKPVDGVDLSYTFARANAQEQHTVQYYEMLGNRAIYANGWLASTVPVRVPWEMTRGEDAHLNMAPNYEWRLYNLNRDFNQTQDRSLQHPERLTALRSLFDEQAERYQVFPVSDRIDFERINSAPRFYQGPRNHYEFWGAGLSLPADVAPQLAGRAFSVTAELTGGDGVIAALGSSLGGWSFYMRDGKPRVRHALSLLPEDQFDLTASEAVPIGAPATVVFEFIYDGDGFGRGGEVAISINGKRVAAARLERTITVHEAFSETFDIGFDGGAPVVSMGDNPNAFEGDLFKVSVDLGPVGAGQRDGH